MNELRWILIGFGIVLLAGIYLWGRRSSAAASESVTLRPSAEPALQPEEPLEAASRLTRAEDYEVAPARPASSEFLRPVPDFRRGRVEPTLTRVEPTLSSDTVTEELPAQPSETQTATLETTPAPTLSSSEATPPPRRPTVRKILSLRLSLAPHRVDGAKLQEVLQQELLTHGKYQIFHRLHGDGQSVFSVASMVEPGSFDLEKMAETLYPGITLFAQLPGPVPGMHALNEMVATARRLHQALGGVLQDERGVPLTVHRIERMRQEVREFERPQSAGARSAGSRSEGWQE
jgi:cell division protein ZipA